MRTGLMIITAAATLGTVGIAAAPASAQGYYGGYRHHDGWRGDNYRRDAWRHARWERERQREWRYNHRHEYGRHHYRGYYGW